MSDHAQCAALLGSAMLRQKWLEEELEKARAASLVANDDWKTQLAENARVTKQRDDAHSRWMLAKDEEVRLQADCAALRSALEEAQDGYTEKAAALLPQPNPGAAVIEAMRMSLAFAERVGTWEDKVPPSLGMDADAVRLALYPILGTEPAHE